MGWKGTPSKKKQSVAIFIMECIVEFLELLDLALDFIPCSPKW